ncbi:hypothetical protein OSB04_004206 [Centaurea solstitialis]|uniref:TF-B3 domain-containing protein n=1 Tax=Centaurea solstitialis TaxID=347529 RepID=A0AA38U821_9ASTR|nr:hypothetical protein OSB04_004206 [Centaurea solstitialis]
MGRVVAEACEECTTNCVLMHKKDKNPSPIATTFFKVMFGDDYSKHLKTSAFWKRKKRFSFRKGYELFVKNFLPPRFARSVRHKVGKRTKLEDSSGEEWKVKFTMIDGLLAFEEGWNAFSTAHGLKVGDFLVFHYVMESHFVVLMYGQSGCPEIRHFGFNQHQMEDHTRKIQNVITDDHRHLSCEPSQSERSENEHPEIRHSVGTPHKDERIKKKGKVVEVPQSVNTKNTCSPLVASSSQPGPAKELVRDENPDNMVSETPPTVVDNDVERIEDEQRREIPGFSVPEINPGKSDAGRKKNVVGGGNETQIKKSGKTLDTRSEESRENPKKSTIMPREATCSDNFLKKRSRSPELPTSRPKMLKKEPAGASGTDTSGSRLHNPIIRPPPSTGISPKSIAKSMKVAKEELMSTVTRVEGYQRDLLHNSLAEDDCIIKPEPVDYDEAPQSVATVSFSAVMSSYEYLELPEWVKLKKVILLRNGSDLWPALTQSWEVFARERGIQPGDNCEFVLESSPNDILPWSVFRVDK